MSVSLRNSVLSVRIANTGAEIKSIKEHATGIEYIWQSDPTYWTGAAPVLFPIIGGLKNGHYRHKGKSYSMPGHGIVRKTDWDAVTSDATQAVFQTASSAETKELFPFDFALKATFSLQENSLAVTYEVRNTGDEMMYFSIGSHPAFNVPFAGGHWENYYLHFSESECIERHFFKDGMTLNETENAVLKQGAGPVLMEPVRARIKLARSGTARVHVLDHDGRRTGRTLKVSDKSFEIDGAKDRTPYYLVVY
jgi:galactose mutarotase-like enzyme